MTPLSQLGVMPSRYIVQKVVEVQLAGEFAYSSGQSLAVTGI